MTLILNLITIGTWVCINEKTPLKCNPIDQKSEWKDKGNAFGDGLIHDIIEKNGVEYVVISFLHGWQTGIRSNIYHGSKKCIPMSEFEHTDKYRILQNEPYKNW